MEEKKLSNKAGVTLTGNWKIALSKDSLYTISSTDKGGRYLSVKANKEASTGYIVFLSQPKEDVGPDQRWEKSADDDSGFFTLKNPNSGLFLTMKTANTLPLGKN